MHFKNPIAPLLPTPQKSRDFVSVIPRPLRPCPSRKKVCTGFSSLGRAKVRVFRGSTVLKSMQLSPSFTRKPCMYLPLTPSQYASRRRRRSAIITDRGNRFFFVDPAGPVAAASPRSLILKLVERRLDWLDCSHFIQQPLHSDSSNALSVRPSAIRNSAWTDYVLSYHRCTRSGLSAVSVLQRMQMQPPLGRLLRTTCRLLASHVLSQLPSRLLQPRWARSKTALMIVDGGGHIFR